MDGVGCQRRAVMGDVMKAGQTISLIAKVFDVRSATRLRSVREEAKSQDSIMPAFAKLAREVRVPT